VATDLSLNTPTKMPVVITIQLGRHLQTESQLVARLVQLGAVQVAGQSQGDSVPQLLLVTQTNLAVGVHLGPQTGVAVQGKLAADGGTRSSSHSAAAGNSSLELGAVLQVDSSTK